MSLAATHIALGISMFQVIVLKWNFVLSCILAEAKLKTDLDRILLVGLKIIIFFQFYSSSTVSHLGFLCGIIIFATSVGQMLKKSPP